MISREKYYNMICQCPKCKKHLARHACKLTHKEGTTTTVCPDCGVDVILIDDLPFNPKVDEYQDDEIEEGL